MKRWFKSLSRQEKMMVFLIVVLLIGVILRWDNVMQKAGIWFRADKILEERADTVPTLTPNPVKVSTATDFAADESDTLKTFEGQINQR